MPDGPLQALQQVRQLGEPVDREMAAVRLTTVAADAHRARSRGRRPVQCRGEVVDDHGVDGANPRVREDALVEQRSSLGVLIRSGP